MIIAVVSPRAYGVSVGLGVVAAVALCAAARRHPGRWTVVAARAIAVALVADAVSWTVRLIVNGTWSAETSLPLALCDVAVLVAAAACWWQARSGRPDNGPTRGKPPAAVVSICR